MLLKLLPRCPGSAPRVSRSPGPEAAAAPAAPAGRLGGSGACCGSRDSTAEPAALAGWRATGTSPPCLPGAAALGCRLEPSQAALTPTQEPPAAMPEAWPRPPAPKRTCSSISALGDDSKFSVLLFLSRGAALGAGPAGFLPQGRQPLALSSLSAPLCRADFQPEQLPRRGNTRGHGGHGEHRGTWGTQGDTRNSRGHGDMGTRGHEEHTGTDAGHCFPVSPFPQSFDLSQGPGLTRA